MTRLSRRLIGITGMSDIVQRRIPVLTLDSKVPGPVVWMTACIHGDEVGGTAIVHEVMESLRHGVLQTGAVHAFPLINSMGFENVSRYINADREDLNRCFPGSATGTMGELSPVVEIDGRITGDGEVGPMTRKLQSLFSAKASSEGTPLPF